MHGKFQDLQQGQAAGRSSGRLHAVYNSRQFLPGRKKNAIMFSRKEHRLLSAPYFRLIRRTDNFYEIQSKNTGHFWIIQKNRASQRYPVTIYHKHTQNTLYYHKHGQAYTVLYALQQIESHDIYQMNGRNAAGSRQGLYFNQGNSIMAAEEQADRPDMRGKGLYETESEICQQKTSRI